MSKLISRIRKRMPYLIQAVAIMWQALRWMMVTWIVITIFQGVLPGIVTYLMKLLVDRLVILFNDWTTEHLNAAAIMLGLLVLAFALSTLLRSAATALKALRQEQVSDYISELIHKQATALDMSFFESTQYYDTLHRAHTHARSRPVDLIDSMANVLRMIISLLSFIVILLSSNLILPVILAACSIPMLYVIAHYNRREHAWEVEATPRQRRVQYYDSILTSREAAAELRVFRQENHFRRAYSLLREQLRNEKLKLVRSRQLALSAVSWLIYAVLGGAMAYTVWQSIQGGAISAGDIVLLYQALFSAQSYFSEIQNELGRIYQTSLYLEHLFLFLDYQPHVVSNPAAAHHPQNLTGDIQFEQVRFQYPGSERWSLDHLNLTIPNGKTIALVGENGAGKSTLIKLLCRLYDPVEGRVVINGMDIRDIPLDKLRERITVLFQQPVLYDETVADNIALGALSSNPTRGQIEAAARASGADSVIAGLPAGYDTLLGKRFGDEDLSIGEWQRIALARALVKPADILVLDEPTSAMDSWTEHEWLEHLREITAGRTTIIVTHRFTTAKQADLIYVMSHGQVIESGTHEELLSLNQHYAASWQQQMQQRANFTESK